MQYSIDFNTWRSFTYANDLDCIKQRDIVTIANVDRGELWLSRLHTLILDLIKIHSRSDTREKLRSISYNWISPFVYHSAVRWFKKRNASKPIPNVNGGKSLSSVVASIFSREYPQRAGQKKTSQLSLSGSRKSTF